MSKTTDKQKVSRERNWLILRLRGVYWLGKQLRNENMMDAASKELLKLKAKPQ